MLGLRQNDVDRCAINDAMFAPLSCGTHHARQRTSLPKATSFARQGKHHSKSSDLVDKSLLFVGWDRKIRTFSNRVKVCCAAITQYPIDEDYSIIKFPLCQYFSFAREATLFSLAVAHLNKM